MTLLVGEGGRLQLIWCLYVVQISAVIELGQCIACPENLLLTVGPRIDRAVMQDNFDMSSPARRGHIPSEYFAKQISVNGVSRPPADSDCL